LMKTKFRRVDTLIYLK